MMLSLGDAAAGQFAAAEPAAPLAYNGWEEAAKASGEGRSSLIAASNSGKLIVRKRGRGVVILREELLRYLRSLPPRKTNRYAA